MEGDANQETEYLPVCLVGDEDPAFWKAFNRSHQSSFTVLSPANGRNLLQNHFANCKAVVVTDSAGSYFWERLSAVRDCIKNLRILLVAYSTDEDIIISCKEQKLTDLQVLKGGRGLSSSPVLLFREIVDCLNSPKNQKKA